MINVKDIRIRDPFILTDKKNKKYYMYGTTSLKEELSTGNSFSVYESADLVWFSEPKVIFQDEAFWADRDFWAAEVHYYKGKYYLFGSFKAKNRCRATQILVSNLPAGKFVPLSDKPVTPIDWECLDGTLYVENDIPYVVFCREWVSVYDGEIYAQRLTDDLKETVGKPQLLFRASENPYLKPFMQKDGKNCYVTDGPFLYHDGKRLNMIWSSFRESKYLVLQAYSDSLLSKWHHVDTPYFGQDGGHSMLFEDFDGTTYIALHQPNIPPFERAVFIKYNK